MPRSKKYEEIFQDFKRQHGNLKGQAIYYQYIKKNNIDDTKDEDEDEEEKKRNEPITLEIERIKKDVKEYPGVAVGLFQHPFRMLVCGSSGSGKTNLITNLIKKYNNYFNDIYVITPTYDIDNTWDQVKGVSAVMREYNDNDFTNFLEERKKLIEEKGKENTKLLLVCDDLAGILKRNSKVKEAFFRGRHYNLSILLATQSLREMPRPIRVNCSQVILFNIQNKTELKIIQDEYSSGLDKDTFMEIYNTATEPKYGFLTIDFHAELEHRYRMNLDKYLIIKK